MKRLSEISRNQTQIKSFLFNKPLFKFILSKNFHFTLGVDNSDILKSSQVNVYKSPEWNEVIGNLQSKGYFKLHGNESFNTSCDIWKEVIMNTSFKPKYFALLPFFFEDSYSTQSKKKFILEMNLLPEVNYLHFLCVLPSGLHEFVENLNDIVPLPAEDYRIRQQVLRSRPADFIDMDMIYGNRKTLNMLLFDKQGCWSKEGVNHKLLNIENSMNEGSWFDHIKVDNNWE